MSVPTQQARHMLIEHRPVAAQVFTLPHCSTVHAHSTHRPLRWRPYVRAALITIAITGAIADCIGVVYVHSQRASIAHRLAELTNSK